MFPSLPPFSRVKNYKCKDLLRVKISKSISVRSEFISGPFPWKRTGLVKVGGRGTGERHRFRAKQGGESKGG